MAAVNHYYIYKLSTYEEWDTHIVKGDIGRWIADNPKLIEVVETLEWEVWDDVEELPLNIGLLQKLEWFAIKGGKSFNSLSNLSSLKKIKSLKLSNCPNLLELPSNLSITDLSITNCDIRSLPRSLQLQNLLYLELKQCAHLQQLPPLPDLECLTIEGCHFNLLQELPPNCRTIDSLEVRVPDDVESFPDVFSHLYLLSNLHIKGGINLKHLPPSLSYIPHFFSLKLENCPQLEELPSNLSIRNLKIKRCGIKLVPGCFTSLGILELEDNFSIIYLPPHLNIDSLTLRGVPINSIPDPFTASTNVLKDQTNMQENDMENHSTNLSDCNSRAVQIFSVRNQGLSFREDYVGGANECVLECYSSTYHGSSSTVQLNIFGKRIQSVSSETRNMMTADKYRRVTWETSEASEGSTNSSSSVRQDVKDFTISVKATYKNNYIKFDLKSTSSFAQLKEEIQARLHLEVSKQKIKYRDEENEWTLMAIPDDFQRCLKLSRINRSYRIKLMIADLQDA